MSETGLGQAASALLMSGVLLGLWRAVRPGVADKRLGVVHGTAAGVGLGLMGWSLAAAPAAPPVLVWEGLALGAAALGLGLALLRLRRRLGQAGSLVLLLHAVFGATGVALVVGWTVG